MPTKDDGVVYWLPTSELLLANDEKAVEHNAYWSSFRDAGEELARAYCDTIDVPRNARRIWQTPRFARMQRLYRTTWPTNPHDQQGAFAVILRYHKMKITRRYVGAAINLISMGDGTAPHVEDTHQVRIDAVQWRFSELRGNHRLMSAFFLGLERVPAKLISKPPD